LAEQIVVMPKTMQSRSAFQSRDPSFITKSGTNGCVWHLKGGRLSQLKELAPFMNRSDAYRARAEACLKLAEAINSPNAKQVLASMAEAWLRLADYVEFRRQNEMGEHLGADGSHDRDANPK
jgi:hypothetical protein